MLKLYSALRDPLKGLPEFVLNVLPSSSPTLARDLCFCTDWRPGMVVCGVLDRDYTGHLQSSRRFLQQ